MALLFPYTYALPLLLTAFAAGQSVPEKTPPSSHAYVSRVEAALRRDDAKTALADSQAMLHHEAYDKLVEDTLNEALHSRVIAFTVDALALYTDRQPRLLAALSSSRSNPSHTPEQIPVHALYADGLAFAALQQLRGEPAAAAATVSTLDAALAPLESTLEPDEMTAILSARRQYALLGRPLPKIALTLSLYSATETPRINRNYGSSTVLLLFPDWCDSCIRMGQALLPTLYRISEREVHLYGLLAQAPPPVATALGKADQVRSAAGSEPIQTAADLLHGTPTLLVPSETLKQFAATDFPLLIATDRRGIVRFIQPAPENALKPGELLDQVTERIAQQWPRQEAVKAAPPTASTQP